MTTLVTEYHWDDKAEQRPDILLAWKTLGADTMTVSWLAFKRGWLACEAQRGGPCDSVS